MAGKTIQTETAEAFGRTFVKGNVPEINNVRCLGCRNCVNLCKKLGPDVLDVVDGVAKPSHRKTALAMGRACYHALQRRFS